MGLNLTNRGIDFVGMNFVRIEFVRYQRHHNEESHQTPGTKKPSQQSGRSAHHVELYLCMAKISSGTVIIPPLLRPEVSEGI